jgi:hypothetical protein
MCEMSITVSCARIDVNPRHGNVLAELLTMRHNDFRITGCGLFYQLRTVEERKSYPVPQRASKFGSVMDR